MLACDPDELAAANPHERTVFRQIPTRMQRGFDAEMAQAAFRKFEEEQQAWIDAAAAVHFKEDRNGRMVTDPRHQVRRKPSATKQMGLDCSGAMTSLFSVDLIGEGILGPGEVISQANLAGPGRRFLDRSLTPSPRTRRTPS